MFAILYSDGVKCPARLPAIIDYFQGSKTSVVGI